MRIEHFRTMVDRLAAEIPGSYLDGIAAIEVSPRTVPHPVHGDVYTLGECIPIQTGTEETVSRIVLYHGSFRALARDSAEFDWEHEARETLQHELQHHLEWRADAVRLEEYDWAVEQNFRRESGEPFDPLFYEAGERVGEAVFRVEDDVFLGRMVTAMPQETDLIWHGRGYRVPVPRVEPPLFLALDGLDEPPPGDVFLVLRRKPRLFDLLRPRPAIVEERARVTRVD